MRASPSELTPAARPRGLRRPAEKPIDVAVPRVSPWWFRFAARYGHRYAARHLHAVRRSLAGGLPNLGDGGAVVYLNHPSWWDPLVMLVMAQRIWPERRHFAAIDAAALGRYRFMESLGFFGVERGTLAGARRFLEVSRAILADPRAMLWLTPQGRFADPRERPVALAAGLGRLACRTSNVALVPVAIEFPFWQERTPECLFRFGPVQRRAPDDDSTAAAWSERLALALEATQDALAAEAQGQRAADFETLLHGAAGVGGVYDAWRRLKAHVRGERFHAEHGGGP